VKNLLNTFFGVDGPNSLHRKAELRSEIEKLSSELKPLLEKAESLRNQIAQLELQYTKALDAIHQNKH